jgi:hypothetical protein
MIDNDELKFRELKTEQINSEIKAMFKEKPGKLGSWPVYKRMENQHKITQLSHETLKKSQTANE